MPGLKPTQEQIASWIEANFDHKTRKRGLEYIINNPFNGDTGYHFNINIEEGLCHDWRGDDWAGGHSKTFIRFVQLYRDCTYVQAIQEVCGGDITPEAILGKLRRDKNNSRAEEVEAHQDDISMPPGSLPLWEQSDKLAGMLKKWLGGRGVDNQMVEEYRLHSHGTCVVWPYYEYDGLVYWQERNSLNKVFRFPPEDIGVTKGMFLYGFDRVEPSSYVIVTEAIFGSMTLGDQCVASGGASLTELQANKLRSFNPVDGIVLAPDNDKAGIESIISNYSKLKGYQYRLFYSLPPQIEYRQNGESNITKDWNDLVKVMSRRDIRTRFEDAILPLNEVQIVKLLGRLPR